MHERTWLLEILLGDRLGRPISQRAKRAGRVVAMLLWEYGGALNEQGFRVPGLQIAAHHAGLWVRTHHGSTGAMGGVIGHDGEVLRTIVSLVMRRVHHLDHVFHL